MQRGTGSQSLFRHRSIRSDFRRNETSRRKGATVCRFHPPEQQLTRCLNQTSFSNFGFIRRLSSLFLSLSLIHTYARARAFSVPPCLETTARATSIAAMSSYEYEVHEGNRVYLFWRHVSGEYMGVETKV